MGIGSYPCGIGPCGLDPLPAASATRSVVPPVALLFDGLTRTFKINPDTGRYYGVTPPAQKVELALLLKKGATPAVPSLGLDLSKVVPAAGPKLQADVDAAVRAALATLLTTKAIRIDEITGTSTIRGRISVKVRYQDLTDPLKPTYTVTVNN